jgi:hypothetical protein
MDYNPPPNWPQPPAGWRPPNGWKPDPAWGPAPEGHKFWVPAYGVPPATQYGSGVVVPHQPPQKSSSGVIWALSGVLVLLIFIGIAVTSGDDGESTARTQPSTPATSGPVESSAPAESSAPPAETTTEAPPPPEPAVAGIGTPVRDGKFEFTVTGVERVGTTIGESFTQETAQGEYLIVRVNVTNVGDEPQVLSSSGQVLYNDKGQKYEPSSDALFSLEGASDFFLQEINPGNFITGAPLLFDVPPGTVLDRIELHDSFFSGGADVSIKGS